MKTSKLAFGMIFFGVLMFGAGLMVFGGAQPALAGDQKAQPAGDMKTAPEAMQPMKKAVMKADTKAAKTEKAAKHAMTKEHKKMAHHRHMMSEEKVKALQAALNKAGYSLKEDGMMGKKTRGALKAFQKANKLKATGRVNKTTLMKLGIL